MPSSSFRNHQEEIDHARSALNAERKGVYPMSKMNRTFTEDEMKRGRETPAIRATPRRPVYVPPPAPNEYEALKAYGFSPAKASEILIDVKRGDAYAKAFLDLAMRNKP